MISELLNIFFSYSIPYFKILSLRKIFPRKTFVFLSIFKKTKN
ncbi:hypothetical protein PCS8203_00427 [Streptococcus pneumoniae PCS8203]|nr:hypothetical protein PCS8203_00427 [Streptococcus pneumoniae PCS8203]